MANQLIDLRHELHSMPELSGREVQTACKIVRFFQCLAPDQTITGLGGNGLAFVFRGRAPGPTVLLRCELDAVPVREAPQRPHRSRSEHVSHACGHDGHMAIMAGVGLHLSLERPARGRVVCLFQPAEETGAGAAAVLADPRFGSVRPDTAFALHNMPGFPLGQVILRSGSGCCASRGMRIEICGTTAHAAQPESGKSPARALCRIMDAFVDLPSHLLSGGQIMMCTVVGARLGQKAFGTAPGNAEIFGTLRSESDEGMKALVHYAEGVVAQAATADGLTSQIAYEEIFPATVNTEWATQIARFAAKGADLHEPEVPFRWSEDFGHFTARYGGALIGLGAGIESPPLHTPLYDFPDALIPIGVDTFLRILDRSLE